MTDLQEQQPPTFHLDGGPPGVFGAAQNPLEVKIIELYQQKASVPEFLEAFFNSTAYIVLPEGQLEASEGRTRLAPHATPFSLKHPDYHSLCFYTHRSRIQLTTAKFAEFECEYAVPVGDFILGIEADVGITINPYWDINFEWSSQQVAGIKKMLKRVTPPDSTCGSGCDSDTGCCSEGNGGTDLE